MPLHVRITSHFSLSLETLRINKDGMIKRIIEILQANFDKRFKLNETMISAAILDPSVQHISAIDDWLAKEDTTRAQVLRDVCIDMGIDIDNIGCDQSSLVIVNTQIQKENDARIFLLKKHSAVSRTSTNLESELSNFAHFKEEVADVLLFWKNHAHRYPTLAKIAEVLLAKPATSAKSESCFSVAGALLTSKRSCINPLRVEKTLFLHDNYHLRDIVQL